MGGVVEEMMMMMMMMKEGWRLEVVVGKEAKAAEFEGNADVSSTLAPTQLALHFHVTPPSGVFVWFQRL